MPTLDSLRAMMAAPLVFQSWLKGQGGLLGGTSDPLVREAMGGPPASDTELTQAAAAMMPGALGVGMVEPANLLSRVLWKLAQQKMDPRIVQKLVSSPEVYRLNVGRMPGMDPLIAGGAYDLKSRTAIMDPSVAIAQALAYPGRRLPGLVGTVAHEMAHGGQQAAGLPYGVGFPGLMPVEGHRASYAMSRPQELLPIFQEQNFWPWARQIVSQPEIYEEALRNWFGGGR